MQLRDDDGRIIAAEGDPIFVGGGFAEGDEFFVACGFVSAEPP